MSVMGWDVNMHKTNSFLRLKFSIRFDIETKRFVLFRHSCDQKQSKSHFVHKKLENNESKTKRNILLGK
jgi:hypothetical protein